MGFSVPAFFLLVAIPAVGLGCSDLFHDTSWPARCEIEPGAAGCAPSGAGAAAGSGGAAFGGGDAGGGGSGVHDDFAEPIVEAGAPANAPELFAGLDDGGTGPCLHEPELGSLFPRNWLRPRFRFAAPPEQNLFEIRLDVPNETSPLLVYTASASWTMPKDVWAILTTVAVDEPIRVRVRGAVLQSGELVAGPSLGSDGEVTIAPVSAPGSVVYWTTSNGTVLKGFAIGDETVQPVITPAQAGSVCVACHTSTPDGKFVALSASDVPDNGEPARIVVRSLDGLAAPAPFITTEAQALLARSPQEAPSFSPAHWQPGDRIALTMLLAPFAGWEIAWTDLEAVSQAQDVAWGVLARMGDPGQAASATFSRDGTTVVYASAPSVGSGVNVTGGSDVWTVPYGNKAGGIAQPLPGASDAAFDEFYPVFSADDALVAFSRSPGLSGSYDNPSSEVFVVPAAGGAAMRLAANDPPACIGKTSPGQTNSWPKWAPDVPTDRGRSYYFMVFSSKRNPTSAGPQLYVAPVVEQAGQLTSYAALYLWNQPETENNHTPAWDVFELPPPP